MHHAGTAQLNPARVLTNATTTSLALEATEIKLGARLRERKVRRSKARDRVRSKHSSQKLSHRALQVRHRDTAIDAQSFDLKEHRIVRGIGSIATKYTAGRDHPNRRAATLHRMNLDGRRLRAKREAVSRVERVLPPSRRMVFGNIERGEVVEVGFDLATVFDRVAKRDEDVFQTLTQQSDRMTMSGAWTTPGHCDVDTLARRTRSFDETLEILLGLVQRLHESGLVGLDKLTKRRAFFRRNTADQLLGRREG